MLKPVYFDSLGINLTGAKLITFEKDYLMYEGLFNYKEIEFSITLCAQYWEEHKFLGNLVGFNYANGFGNIEKVKKIWNRLVWKYDWLCWTLGWRRNNKN